MKLKLYFDAPINYDSSKTRKRDHKWACIIYISNRIIIIVIITVEMFIVAVTCPYFYYSAHCDVKIIMADWLWFLTSVSVFFSVYFLVVAAAAAVYFIRFSMSYTIISLGSHRVIVHISYKLQYLCATVILFTQIKTISD